MSVRVIKIKNTEANKFAEIVYFRVDGEYPATGGRHILHWDEIDEFILNALKKQYVVVHEATLGKWWSLGDLSDVDVTKAEIFYDANGMRHNLFVSLLSAQEDLPYFADTFIEIPVTPDSYSSIRSIYNVAKEQVLHLNKLNNNKIKIYTNNGIQVN